MSLRFLKISIFLLLTLKCILASNFTDFYATNFLPDGEMEVRVHFKGITAKETTVSSRSETKLSLRQLTDGKHFIQLIYDGHDNIKDCEYLHKRGHIFKFLKKFNEDFQKLTTTSNVTVEYLNDDNKKTELPEEIKSWLNFETLKKRCKRNHKAIKKAMKQNRTGKRRSRHTRALSDYFIAPGTLWCGPKDVAHSYTDLGGLSMTDKCCRKHDHCKNNIHGFTNKYNYYNARPFTLSHCWCDNRRKRDLSDIFRIPGTKWCGKGYSAKKYTHLGGFSRTDKCCRVHDTACPFWIGGFETKYGLFNWRVNTIMHCGCDDRFRACLKMADTSDANLVGKLFFNVVQTRCFVLKPKKVCVRRSWWGKCTKKKYTKQAVLRDNLAY